MNNTIKEAIAPITKKQEDHDKRLNELEANVAYLSDLVRTNDVVSDRRNTGELTAPERNSTPCASSATCNKETDRFWCRFSRIPKVRTKLS